MMAVSSGLPPPSDAPQGGERHAEDLEVSVRVLPGHQVAPGRQPH